MDTRDPAYAGQARIHTTVLATYDRWVPGLSADHSLPARAVIRIGNWQGGFDCLHDTADGVRSMLEESFDEVELEVGPSTADFVARGPY